MHTDFTEMAALQNFGLQCSLRQSKSILTGSLLVASEFVSIYSISKYAIAMCCIAQRDKWSFGIRSSPKFSRSLLTRNDLREHL